MGYTHNLVFKEILFNTERTDSLFGAVMKPQTTQMHGMKATNAIEKKVFKYSEKISHSEGCVPSKKGLHYLIQTYNELSMV